MRLVGCVAASVLVLGFFVVGVDGAPTGPLSDTDRRFIIKEHERIAEKNANDVRMLASAVRDSGRELWGFGLKVYFGRLGDVRGLIIAHVSPDSPAESAGLKQGDLVEWAMLTTQDGHYEVGILGERRDEHQGAAYRLLDEVDDARSSMAELDAVFVRPIVTEGRMALERVAVHLSAVVVVAGRTDAAEALAGKIERAAEPLLATVIEGMKSMTEEVARARTWEEFVEREKTVLLPLYVMLENFLRAAFSEANAFIGASK